MSTHEIYQEFWVQFDWQIWLCYFLSGTYLIGYEVIRKQILFFFTDNKGVKSLKVNKADAASFDKNDSGDMNGVTNFTITKENNSI